MRRGRNTPILMRAERPPRRLIGSVSPRGTQVAQGAFRSPNSESGHYLS